MNVIWILASKEIRDAMRNRWIAAAIILLGILALVIAILGSAPTGAVRASTLDITVVSLASLSVYLIPLIALMLSFDSLVSEFERGTMMLLLTYPVKRWQVIMGKFIAHVSILCIAVFAGYGGAILIMTGLNGGNMEGWQAYLAMMLSTIVLGAVFIGLGYAISISVKERATAVGAAMAVWLIFVVLYDLVLFGILILDKGQAINPDLFSFLMIISPTDTYRIFNLSLFDNVSHAAGLANIANQSGISHLALATSMLAWIVLPLAATLFIFQRREL